MSYKEDLSTASWQKIRLKVYERDNYKCQSKHCKHIGEDQSLQVHHLDYIDGLKPWEYPMDMLITLCKYCHELENQRPELEKHLAATFKNKGFLLGDLLHLSCKIDTDKRFTEILLKILRDY